MKKRLTAMVLSVLIIVVGACRPTEQSEPNLLIMPTDVSPSEPNQRDAPENTSPTLPPPPTMIVADESEESPEATPEAIDIEPDYQVAYVEAGDVLNIRSGPGVDNEIVGSLSRNQSGIFITGRGQLISGSTWVPVSADGVAGWVNGRFLIETPDEDTFCQDENVRSLLDDLRSAIGSKDGELLSGLIHPERGLRIRLNWWNPEILLRGDDLSELLSSPTVYEWGTEDGSGNAIEGTFNDTALPMLVEDLLGSTESACNQILQGGTAGIVKLPDNYPNTSYYSFHRPGTDEFSGLNWGTWVIGVEKWQNRSYISFLVHFGWEI